MTDSGSARRQRSVPIWARLATGGVVAVGAFCLAYHLVFWFLWRFLFGEEVWPWPAWDGKDFTDMPVLAVAGVEPLGAGHPAERHRRCGRTFRGDRQDHKKEHVDRVRDRRPRIFRSPRLRRRGVEGDVPARIQAVTAPSSYAALASRTIRGRIPT